jgi:uncharacterized cupredoxin-like copper-binding protein
MRTQRFDGFGLALAAALGFACSGEEAAPAASAPPPAGAEAPKDSSAPASDAHDHSAHAGHEGMGADTATAGQGSAWASLNALHDEIAGVVAAGKLSEVHAKSERLGPLGDALRGGAASLPEDSRRRVEGALGQLAKVAERLHEAADSGDAARTKRELARLGGLLELVRAHFPADALEAVPAPTSAAGHASHDHGSHAHTARPLAAVDDPPTTTLRVRANEFKFEPATLTLRAGEATRIELENSGVVDHALIVQAPDGKGDWIHLHALAHATDAGTFRIDQRGKYPVLCTIAGHTEAGMVGELVVQ